MKIRNTAGCVIVFLTMGLGTVHAADAAAGKEAQIKVEIKQLVDSYAINRDNSDAKAYANLFTEDGRFEINGEVLVGRAVLRKHVEESNPNVTRMHIMSTSQITVIDEHTATGIQYVTVYAKTLEAPVEQGYRIPVTGFAVMGKYVDKYELTDDGWKFAERKMHPVFTSAD